MKEGGFMKWWPAKFRASTLHMTLLERGIYRELLDVQFESDGFLDATPDRLRRMVRATEEQWEEAWPTVREKFHEDEDGRLYHPRVLACFREAKARSIRGKELAQRRWSKKEKKRSALPTQSEGNANAHAEERRGEETRGEEEENPPQKGGPGGSARKPTDQEDDGVRALPRRAIIPPELLRAIPNFQSLWRKRLENANRRPTVSAEADQLADAVKWLDDYGPEGVRAAVADCTRAGWQGLFPPKGIQRPRQTATTFQPEDPDREESNDAIVVT